MFRRTAVISGICTALVVLVSSAPGEALTYKIDTAHSNVGFSIRHLVSKVRGSFDQFSGTLHYDPEAPGKSKVSATIDVSSIDTGNDRRDDHLRSPDFFGVENYPTITFESTGARKDGDRLMVTGDLTMHGVTRQVTLPVEVLGTGVHPRSKEPIAGFSAELKLNRSDYGVNSWTDPTGIVGDEVSVTINIEAVKAEDPNPCNPCAGENPDGE